MISKKIGIAGFLILIVFGAFGLVYWFYYSLNEPNSLESDSIVIISKGSGINYISRQLGRKGIISQPLVFKLAVIAQGLERVIRAGEYLIPKASSNIEVLSIFKSGKTVVRRFLVAEGLYTTEIIDRLQNTYGLVGNLTEIPKEGELLPETYHFSFGDERSSLVRRMKAEMKSLYRELWSLRKPSLPFSTWEEAIILASIVEKETGKIGERARVAAVFINRLKLGMRLQSDPTVIYGLTKGRGNLNRPLSRNDLKSDNPYNTYIIKGLPPGPISNPGRASIKAVLNPIVSKELYFVSDGKGGHSFSKTLSQHNKNVKVLRNLEKNFNKNSKTQF